MGRNGCAHSPCAQPHRRPRVAFRIVLAVVGPLGVLVRTRCARDDVAEGGTHPAHAVGTRGIGGHLDAPPGGWGPDIRRRCGLPLDRYVIGRDPLRDDAVRNAKASPIVVTTTRAYRAFMPTSRSTAARCSCATRPHPAVRSSRPPDRRTDPDLPQRERSLAKALSGPSRAHRGIQALGSLCKSSAADKF